MWRAGQLRCIYRGRRSAGQYSSNCNYSEGEGGDTGDTNQRKRGKGGGSFVHPRLHILYMIRDWTRGGGAREETRRPSARQWSAEYQLPWEILGPAATAAAHHTTAAAVVVAAVVAMSGPVSGWGGGGPPLAHAATSSHGAG